MPWKLVGFIVCLILGTCFAGFNLDNSCNISFGFITFQNIPIFFSLIVAFSCGVIITLPFTVIKKKSAKEKKALMEEKFMKKIKRQQDKDARVAVLAEKRSAKEAKKAEKNAKKLQKQNSGTNPSSIFFASSGNDSETTNSSKG